MDTGVGIPQEKISELFRMFQARKMKNLEHTSGIGLGLTYCKAISQKLRGHMTCESEVGKGSKFTITLNVGRRAGDNGLS